MSLWLIFWMLAGGGIGWVVIKRVLILIEHLPYRQRPLKCLVPYVPVAQRTETGPTADAD